MSVMPPGIIIAKLRARINRLNTLLAASREQEKATKKLLLQAARAHEHYGGENLFELRESIGPEFGRAYPELDDWLNAIGSEGLWKD